MNPFPALPPANNNPFRSSLPDGLAPAITYGAFCSDGAGRDNSPVTDTHRNHLIVAFSDQMATPQTRFFGTIKAATNAGRKYANQHLKRSIHTHRHLVILDDSKGKRIAISLK
jgi:hypothetical protein